MAKESKFKKETKIGIGVIGVLLVVFGIVLFNRLSGSDVSTADANTKSPQVPRKTETPQTETPPPAPTLVDTGTTQASYTDAATRDAAEQRWESSSRRDDVDQSARRSYMPASQTQDDSRYDDAPESVPAKTSVPYDRYASDRSPTREADTRQESVYPYRPAAQDDQFRQRDVNTADQNPIVQNATDQPEGRVGTTQQALVDDREIGRDEFEPQEVIDNRAVMPSTTVAPKSPIVSQDVVQQEFAPTDAVAAQPVEQAVVPHRPASGKYTVMPNDNYSTIAKRVYGNAGYFKALAEYNREAHPRIHNLQVGDEVLTPKLTVLREKFGSLCPKVRTAADPNQLATLVTTTGPTKVYVVEEGDTIYDIAKYELGKASRWAEIIALNRALLGSDIHFVRPGMKLLLPDDTAADQPETQQPASRVVRQVAPDAPLVQ